MSQNIFLSKKMTFYRLINVISPYPIQDIVLKFAVVQSVSASLRYLLTESLLIICRLYFVYNSIHYQGIIQKKSASGSRISDAALPCDFSSKFYFDLKIPKMVFKQRHLCISHGHLPNEVPFYSSKCPFCILADAALDYSLITIFQVPVRCSI